MLNDEKFVERLKKAAKRQCWTEDEESEDAIINDYAGGNIDDAYQGGVEDGETYLAREILTHLKIEWNTDV
jgi:hypothetical protein